jgi:uncharacterized protein YecT (DUF1311 family)
MRVQLTLFLFSATAAAQLTGADPQVQSACAAAAAAPLPADIAGLPTPKTYPTCDSYSLYDDKKDDVSARACAIQERAALVARIPGSPSAPNQDDPAGAGGLVVLTELYANGQGVAQNPPLAARFFCEAIDTGEVESDPSQTQAILATLERLKALTPSAPRVAFCNDADPMLPIENTPSTRDCDAAAELAHAEMHASGIQSGIDDAQQAADDADQAVKPVLAKFTPARRTAYNRAADAMQRFISTQATGDFIYMGGYGSGGLYPNYYHADFEDQVVDYVTHPPAAPAPADAAQADAALNQVYRKLMDAAAQEETAPFARITAETLRAEQRAWLAWRDAMVALGATLNPRLPASAWWLPLTVKRTKDLSDLYDVWGKGWIDDGQKQRDRLAEIEANQNARLAQSRAEIAPFFDRQTPAQAAAWQRVQSAITALAAARDAEEPGTGAGFARQQLDALYGELHAFQYNGQHGYLSADPARAQAAFAASEARLNQAYQADLASPCLAQPVPGDPHETHRTPETFRAEQRAWLELRDAWVDFLSQFYPSQSHAALANMFTSGRAFELEMLMRLCPSNPQPPRTP